MDPTAVLVALTAVVVFDTVAVVAVLVLVLRSRASWPSAGPSEGAGSSSSSTAASTAVPAPSSDRPAEGGDPLAASIATFLARPEGVFRADPGAVPAAVPTRLILSGAAVPTADRDRSPGSLDRLPVAGPEAVGPGPAAPIARPASGSSVRLRLVAVDPDTSGPSEAAASRLGPVIAGWLRERTRGSDPVRRAGRTEFDVELPTTEPADAEAYAARVAVACGPWLAAETPSLRLDHRVDRRAPGPTVVAPGIGPWAGLDAVRPPSAIAPAPPPWGERRRRPPDDDPA